MIVKIFNINMWLLPFRLSKHNKKRVNLLLDFIKKTQADVITLQEVWDTKHIDFLKKNLPEYYFSYVAKKRLNISGVVTFSRYKPTSVDFFPFRKTKEMNFIEKRVKKGILKTEYKIKGRSLIFYNTHLYNPTSEAKKRITKIQFESIKSKIMPNQTIFFCGDLNLKKIEFERQNKGFFSYAEKVNNTFSSKSKYLKKWWDPKVKANKKIDYVLIKTKSKFSFQSKSINNDLSDHFGIYTEIKFDD
jgi:exonuclease III